MIMMMTMMMTTMMRVMSKWIKVCINLENKVC